MYINGGKQITLEKSFQFKNEAVAARAEVFFLLLPRREWVEGTFPRGRDSDFSPEAGGAPVPGQGQTRTDANWVLL